MDDLLKKAAEVLSTSEHAIAFTGAGISVESGIPPFRGEGGLWSEYDPDILDLGLYMKSPEVSWPVIKKLFYDFFGQATPNPAHITLADLEKLGILKETITQNIDNLHQDAGSRIVREYHGNSQQLVCTGCGRVRLSAGLSLSSHPPLCKHCSSLLKPDFVFFGEGIPLEVQEKSEIAARKSDVVLIIGTTGEIYPACYLPHTAKQNGAVIIEVNTTSSEFTHSITDIFIKGKAGEVLPLLGDHIKKMI